MIFIFYLRCKNNMAYKKNLESLLATLSTLVKTGPTASMVSVKNRNVPADYFQVLDMYDGTFLVQRLKWTSCEHEVIFRKYVDKKDRGTIPDMLCPSEVSSMELWGDSKVLISYDHQAGLLV